MKRKPFRSLLNEGAPLVTPLAHDALAARLIERAGFRAFAIGGSAMLATRYALPDLGLAGLADMAAGIRDIAQASALPFLATRQDPDTLIIGRTDACGLLGIDAALHRATRFLSVGVDGVFIAGVRTVEDYERIGRELRGTFLSAALFEGGATPWLLPAALGAMGYSHVSFPAAHAHRRGHARGARPVARVRGRRRRGGAADGLRGGPRGVGLWPRRCLLAGARKPVRIGPARAATTGEVE